MHTFKGYALHTVDFSKEIKNVAQRSNLPQPRGKLEHTMG